MGTLQITAPAGAAEARGVARIDRQRVRDALARVFQEALVCTCRPMASLCPRDTRGKRRAGRVFKPAMSVRTTEPCVQCPSLPPFQAR